MDRLVVFSLLDAAAVTCFDAHTMHGNPIITVIADVPLKKLEAYYEIYIIKRECEMFQFAKSKIPGFNPTRGYGYCEIISPTDIVPQSTIILMNKVGFTHYFIQYVS